jgi:hypothetical protein
MSKPKLILIGAGGHAHACIDVIEQHGGYQIAGLVGKPEEMHDHHLGYTVIGTDDDLPKLAKTVKLKPPHTASGYISRSSHLGLSCPPSLLRVLMFHVMRA